MLERQDDKESADTVNWADRTNHKTTIDYFFVANETVQYFENPTDKGIDDEQDKYVAKRIHSHIVAWSVMET